MPDDEVAALQARSQVPTGIAGSRVSADGVSTPPRLWPGWRLGFPSPGGFGSPCRKRWYYLVDEHSRRHALDGEPVPAAGWLLIRMHAGPDVLFKTLASSARRATIERVP